MSDDGKDDKEGIIEKHPSGKDGGVKKQKPKKVASRFFNAVLGVTFFVVFVMSLVSFSASSNSYRKISGTELGSLGGACALNADGTSTNGVPGSDGACQFSIGGQVVLAVYAGLSVAVMIIKIIGGWSMISCFLVFELISLFVMGALSFSVSLVISIGLSLSCRRLKDDTNDCADFTVYGKNFYTDLEVAQATSWLGFAILVGIFVFYILCVVMYGYGRRQEKRGRKEALKKAIAVDKEDSKPL